MPGGLVAGVDPSGLLEYSVVYTDRAVNHMSVKFQQVMRDISSHLNSVYNSHTAVIVPGSGTYGMEAVVRQFANNKRCLVIRNGFFSFRWSQIIEVGNITNQHLVLKARRIKSDENNNNNNNGPLPFIPPPIDEVIEAINSFKPEVLFMPHVETSSGIIVSNEYITAITNEVHKYNGIVVLDCIASGGLWVNMKEVNVDILISAPQKGWCGPACCAFVMMNEPTRKLLDTTTSTSFILDLKKWTFIMDTYVNGAHAYHATMPTDALTRVRDVMNEIKEYGFDKFKQNAIDLGTAVRKMLTEKGFVSVAHISCQSPTVVVSFTTNKELQNGKITAANGLQIAAGVPLQCDEGPDYCSFRIGLFGLEKNQNIERTVQLLKDGLTNAGL